MAKFSCYEFFELYEWTDRHTYLSQYFKPPGGRNNERDDKTIKLTLRSNLSGVFHSLPEPTRVWLRLFGRCRLVSGIPSRFWWQRRYTSHVTTMFTYQTPTRHALLAHEKRHSYLIIRMSQPWVVYTINWGFFYWRKSKCILEKKLHKQK